MNINFKKVALSAVASGMLFIASDAVIATSAEAAGLANLAPVSNEVLAETATVSKVGYYKHRRHFKVRRWHKPRRYYKVRRWHKHRHAHRQVYKFKYGHNCFWKTKKFWNDYYGHWTVKKVRVCY